MRLVVDNKQILFKGPPALRKRVDERTSFRVLGYRFSPAYKARQWDGKEHLAKHVEDGLYRAPVGMLDEVTKVAAAMDLEWIDVVDNRRRPSPGSVRTKWDHIDFAIRPYQQDASDAIIAPRGYRDLGTGKGLIDIATRGGKTVVILYTIHRLGVPSLILVQSERVMKQTVTLARRVLKVKIGVIGAGVWKPKDITVASVQTLVRHADKQHCRDLMRRFDFVNFDECHHLQGKKWRAVLEMCDAWYKAGTSATIFLHRKKETPKGTIWMRAATGPVLYKISPSELIKQGYLVPPTIELFTVDGPKIRGAETWDEIYKFGIVEHHVRNSKVSGKAGEYHERGLTVLVNVRLLDHVDILEQYLIDLGLKVTVVIGPTPTRDRDRRVKAFVNRRVDILLGTIFKEGVDIPEIEGVVNAAGGKSKIAAIQQFRNLTPASGKSTAVLADAMDLHHPTLAKHSLERLKVYRAHEMFDVGATR